MNSCVNRIQVFPICNNVGCWYITITRCPLVRSWGRKFALVLSCTLVGVIGTAKAFSVSYEMYVLVEFLETVAGASAFPAAYILSELQHHQGSASTAYTNPLQGL